MNFDKKFWGAVVILAVWGALVVSGFAPAADYLTVLRDVLIGLGVFHAVSTTIPPQQ